MSSTTTNLSLKTFDTVGVDKELKGSEVFPFIFGTTNSNATKIDTAIGKLNDLAVDSSAKTSLVAAVNNTISKLGDLSDLETSASAKVNLVAAINYALTSASGSMWYYGTGITGNSTTPTVFSGSGVAEAFIEDMYLNTDACNVYVCTLGGAASTAKWKYIACLKGASGSGTGDMLASVYDNSSTSASGTVYNAARLNGEPASSYSPSTHTHSEYAASNHTHSDYAALTHTHSGYAASTHTHNYAGSSSAGGAATTALACTGNAATATELELARTICLVGDVSGEGVFDGSSDLEISVIVNDNSHKHTVSNITDFAQSLASNIIGVTGNKTLSLNDANTLQKVTSASATTITIPLNSAVAFPVKTEVEIVQYCEGNVTIVGATGVTINSYNGYTSMLGQYASVCLKKMSENEWLLSGALAEATTA